LTGATGAAERDCHDAGARGRQRTGEPDPAWHRPAASGYSIAASQTLKLRIKLTSAGKKLLKKHKNRLTVKLVITPSGGIATTTTIKLKIKR
jgi:hypothetical protein